MCNSVHLYKLYEQKSANDANRRELELGELEV